MWTTAAKNSMLDSETLDLLSLHSDDPGAAGTDNEVTGGGYSKQAATFNAASGGERALNADVQFSMPSEQPVAYVGFWTAGTPNVFRGAAPAVGDAAANVAGEYIVPAADTKASLVDPA